MSEAIERVAPSVSTPRSSGWLRLALVVVAAALLALAPQLVKRDDVINLLFIVLLYISLGQSWNILAGFVGQTSLGHAAFFGIGALTTRTLWTNGGPFLLALLLGALAATLFALVIGVPTFRLRGAYFAIGTLGMAEALRITISQTSPLVSTLPTEQIVGYNLATRYYLALVLALATIGAAAFLLRSRLSLGMLAVREDEEAAQATGVNPLKHKLIAFTISSFFAGLAGGVFAFYHVSYYPEATFSPHWTFDALLISFVGGLGTIGGPVIGAIFYVLVRERLAVTLVDVHQILFGVLFIIVVLVFPGGLVEAWDRLRQARWFSRRAR
ncbi:MAG TPA: branched-chain amino acid ABC transporter permease [Anaerolineae bacterium]|nr:branched-chain amino acid ABC transporter permease [Anaerolineae bacterium]